MLQKVTTFLNFMVMLSKLFFLNEFNSFFAQGLLVSHLHPALYAGNLACVNYIHRLLFLYAF